MNLKSGFTGLLCGLGVLCAQNASAQIAEVRLGVTEFDERTLNAGLSVRSATENSIGISGEILFEDPGFLKWAYSPKPYIGGMLNLGGKTSFAGAGLLWRQGFGDKFYGDFSIGLAVHTGTTQFSRNPGETQQEFFRRLNKNIGFGSRVLAREQIALGYNLSEQWAAEVYFEHLSNAGLGTSNEGVDNLGFRIARKF